ncbi:MAG: DNA-formamidopyrimidine glycosylase [Chloroflexi bacterium]|jgi:formamidopyrimidine-DNA glycosylase|nr:DNA-formamidopyrimidine glycosylase [Chloroflexota bacterium]
MPELPEVESIRNKFRLGSADNPALLGKTIRGVELLWPRTLETPPPDEFSERILGQKIIEIGRRGKYLLFHLDDATLVIHLRMSGDLFYEPVSAPLKKHHRLVLILDDEHRLAFNDARKFGRIWLVDDPVAMLAKLGPEPFDENLTATEFHHRLQRHRRQIKPLLLDQGFLAGVGNIYADESLHLAKIHPLTRSHTISLEAAQRLLANLRHVLKEGIRRNGASIDWVYRGGDYQNQFQVYQRTGEACFRCQTPIERIVVGQRGTHFCPQCQCESLPQGHRE